MSHCAVENTTTGAKAPLSSSSLNAALKGRSSTVPTAARREIPARKIWAPEGACSGFCLARRVKPSPDTKLLAFLSLLRSFCQATFAHPRLTSWAAFFRRFAAGARWQPTRGGAAGETPAGQPARRQRYGLAAIDEIVPIPNFAKTGNFRSPFRIGSRIRLLLRRRC
jgi:hypothetical protein